MSRPTTRSKNKRHKLDNGDGILCDILRKIHRTGEITEDDIRQLYMTWKPVCQGCRVNSKDNPNCFCGLIPPSNGTRKSGLWQKMSDIVLALGPDPCKDLRASTESPAGLTNLGATCYANSILQCLYFNTSFREGIFSVEPDLLKQQPVLDQLARLFAQLHSSKMAFVDSAPFIKILELDNGVQQDSHEFLTLLLSLLERSLSHSNVPKSRTIVQDLFRGSVSHVTRCSICGNNSEASSKMEDFYELELNIKGLENLDASLDDYLSVEELQGDNQYFCEFCGTRVDATRCIKLRTLPDVLNFQLKRCVFLSKTTTKKKITSLFSFPRELDMGRRLSEPSQLDLVYDLSAVLIHKGTAVNSGHYVAHIWDKHMDQWWEFDDEHVLKLGSHPFGEGSSSSTVKPLGVEPLVSHSCHGSVNFAVNGTDSSEDQMQPSNVVGQTVTFSSADAYMLMYNRRSSKVVGDKTCTTHSTHVVEIEGMLESSCSDDTLPLHIAEEIKKLNSSIADACHNYKLKKEKEVGRIMERRLEVRSVLAEAAVKSDENPYFWIFSDWLRQWADSVTPPVLDNTSIQCLHGRIPVSNISIMKRLSANAWTKLLSKYGGGPALSNCDCCIDCLMDGARTTVHAEDHRERRASMKDLADAALAGKGLEGTLYYVSRTWLLQWLRKKNVNAPCEVDVGPTASIRCPHGSLLPEQAAGAKRLLVPENLWLFFYECSNAVKPDDVVGCSTFPADLETCPQCRVDLTEVAYYEDSLRASKLKQRQNHEKLALGKSIALSPGCKYYLVPSSWLTKWKNYITASGKNILSSAEPEGLEGVFDMLKCEKHLRLLERPLELINRRGVITQRASATDGLTIITESDWKYFCEEWDCPETKGIRAEIEFANCTTNKLVGSCEEVPVLEEHLNPQDEVVSELESRPPIIKTFPESCEHCIGERESCELMQKLNYINEDICVFLVRGKEAPRSIIEASGTFSEQDRRMSKRSRKTTYGNSLNLKVSGSTSVYQLKMMIWESLGVVKENQILHKGSRVIDGESASLADMNIFPGDVLWVTDSEVHENRDIADELSEQKEVQPVEEGFRGTLLTSNISTKLLVQEW